MSKEMAKAVEDLKEGMKKENKKRENRLNWDKNTAKPIHKVLIRKPRKEKKRDARKKTRRAGH